MHADEATPSPLQRCHAQPLQFKKAYYVLLFVTVGRQQLGGSRKSSPGKELLEGTLDPALVRVPRPSISVENVT